MSDENQPTNTEETPAVSESEEATAVTKNETTDDAPKNEDDVEKEEESTATFEPVVCNIEYAYCIFIFKLVCSSLVLSDDTNLTCLFILLSFFFFVLCFLFTT
jgi:hypothetical protein